MSAELRRYVGKDPESFDEYVVIVTDPKAVDEMAREEDLILQNKVRLPDTEDWVSWPTDTMLVDEAKAR